MAASNDRNILPVECPGTLGEEHLSEVLISLYGLAPKWNLVGLHLGVHSAILDTISTKESDPEIRLLEAIKTWLKGNFNEDKYGQPSWSSLACAVDHINKAAANKIRQQHGITTLGIPHCEERYGSQELIERSDSKHRSPSKNAVPARNISVFDSTDDRATTGCFTFPRKFRSKSAYTVSRMSRDSAQLLRVLNPASIMNYHTSYHGNLTGYDAEQLLKLEASHHCYLIRYSKKRKCYVLSVKYMKTSDVDVAHFRIQLTNRKLWLDSEGNEVVFDSLEDLLHHYQNNPLNYEIFGIGDECKSKVFVKQQLS